MEDDYEGMLANSNMGLMAKGIWRKVSDADIMSPRRDFSRTGLVFFGPEGTEEGSK